MLIAPVAEAWAWVGIGSGQMAWWRVFGLAQARLGVKAAGGRWLGAVTLGALGTLGLGRQETRGPLAGTLVARALSGRPTVWRCPTKAGPWHPSTG